MYFTSIMALATNARAPLTVRWGLCVRRCGGVGCGYAIGTPDCARRAPPIARVRRNTLGAWRRVARGAWAFVRGRATCERRGGPPIVSGRPIAPAAPPRSRPLPKHPWARAAWRVRLCWGAWRVDGAR